MRPTAVVLLLALCACAPRSDSTSEAKAVENVLLRQEAAWNRGDIDAFMSGYWNNPGVRFVSGDRIVYGWAATLARYHARYATREKMGQLAFSDLHIDMLAPDAALVMGNWRLARAGDLPHGIFTLVFRKIDGQWVIVLDHTS